MAKFCVHERACVDIVDIGDIYVASIWLYGTQHQIGPYNSRGSVVSAVRDYINDLRFVAEIKEQQQADLSGLQKCLNNFANQDKH